MTAADFCKRPGCGHHRDDHATVGLPAGEHGGCCNRHCKCSEFLAYLHGGQRGSEAGCYS